VLLYGLVKMRIYKISKTKCSHSRSINESIQLHYQTLKYYIKIYQIKNPKLINIKLTFLSEDT
jgi:predicted transcriptional regulator